MTSFDFAGHVANMSVDNPPIDTIGVKVDEEGRLVWGVSAESGGTEVPYGRFFVIKDGQISSDDTEVRAACRQAGRGLIKQIGVDKPGQGPISGYAVINYILPNLCRIESSHATLQLAQERCIEQSKFHFCAIRQIRKDVVHATAIGAIPYASYPFGSHGYPSWFEGWAQVNPQEQESEQEPESEPEQQEEDLEEAPEESEDLEETSDLEEDLEEDPEELEEEPEESGQLSPLPDID